ncbi:MAG TPA: zf-HC2 domain-containing protein [Planctomycetota bacterium]
MNCARFQVAVHEHYRGTLTPEESAALEAHARACPACAALREACEETCCKDFVATLPEWLEGNLEPAEQRRHERHLAICPDCRAYLESYRTAIALTATAFQTPAEPLPEALVRAILARRRADGDGDV